MRRYPISAADIISQADIDAGRTNLVYFYQDLVHSINAAFYDGFLLAMCETKEDFQNITPEDRIYSCLLAKQTMEAFLPSEPEKGGITQ